MDKDSSEVQRLSGQYRQLKQEMDVLKADMIHLKSWLIKNKCYEVSDNCETVDEKVDITTEVADLEERMIELTLHISQKDTLIVELKESLENARNKIKDLEMNLENTRDKIQDLESILEEKTKETISLTADLVSKDKKLSRALEHINEIEKEKAELQATLESKFQELESMKSDYGNYTNFVKHGQEQNGIFYSDGEDAVEEIEVNEVEEIEVQKVEETDLNKVHNIEEVDEVVVIYKSIDNKPSEQSFEDAKRLEERENDNIISCEVINESDDYFEMESYLEPEVVMVEYDCQEVNVKENEASVHEETVLDIEKNGKEYDSSSQDFDSSSLEEKLQDEKVKRIKEDYNTSNLSGFESTKQYEEPIIPGLKHTVSGACRLGLWNPCIQSLEEKLKPYSSAYEQFLTVKDCPNFLSMAAEQGLDDLIAVLLANGMSPNQTVDRLGTVLLHTAVKGYHKPLVRLLLKKGASTEKRDCSKKTPLHYATEYGYFDISKILIDNNANINVKDECGKTPLHHAAVSGTEELIELLLCDNRCDKDVVDVFGRKAFDYTYQKEHIMRIFKKY